MEEHGFYDFVFGFQNMIKKRKKKIMGYPKGISLSNIFQKFFYEKKKLIFLTTFYISYKWYQFFLKKWSINKCPKDTC